MRLSKRSGTDARARRWRVPALLASAALLGTGVTVGVAAPSAQAASTTDAYLGGLGIYTTQCPVTPSNVVYVQPGTTVKFHADATGLGAATGVALVGLQTQMTNPLNAKQNLTVTTAANGFAAVGFGSEGTYGFSWNVQTGYIQVLGATVPTGIVASTTGAKLSYSGQIVVSSRTQGCTLAPQIPSVQVAPSLPVVGQLPTISVPGAQLPSVTIPGATQAPSSTAPSAGATGGATSSNPYGYAYTPPTCTGPCLVVPRGGGSGGRVGGASDVTLGQIGDAAAAGGGSGSGSGAGSDAALVGSRPGSGDQLAVDRAFSRGGLGDLTGPGLSIGLALAAAAAFVASTVLWVARRRLAHG